MVRVQVAISGLSVAAQEAAKKAQASAQQQEATREQQAEAAARAAAQNEAREKAAAEAKARSEEEAARARDLEERRRKALAEAEAIRAMMAAPKKSVMVAKKPEEPKPAAKPAAVGDAKKGTLHKPAVGTGTGPRNAGAAAPAAPGAGSGKEVKSAKLSSSWANDTAKKKNLRMFAARPFVLNTATAALAGVAVRAITTKTTTIIKG